MRISDWSSDVCSSDLLGGGPVDHRLALDRFLEIFGDRIAVDQKLAALLIDHDRGTAGRVEVDEFVASFPRRFAHQLITNALFAEQKENFARAGTKGELIELPHAHGIATSGPGAQRLCGRGAGYST